MTDAGIVVIDVVRQRVQKDDDKTHLNWQQKFVGKYDCGVVIRYYSRVLVKRTADDGNNDGLLPSETVAEADGSRRIVD